MNRLFLACVFLVAAIAAVSASCSPGYTQRAGGNCYKLWSTKREWWVYADHVCRAEGAWLATIRNTADSVWVNNFFITNRGHHCNLDWYWIGANDLAREGRWRWAEDGSELSYFNWLRGEPNNMDNEDVVQVNSNNRKWNDNEVTHTYQLCYVCEKNPI
ncbi:perlucin-like protein [Patiria miniata]|uniref:C-type lectin domain-containing protein n=1 Tax=Patiria miniata TaxID=46514 RepID=A0A913Z4S3_PATMI|nr:perlucin-like protein [Patiria miniata]